MVIKTAALGSGTTDTESMNKSVPRSNEETIKKWLKRVVGGAAVTGLKPPVIMRGER